MVLVPKSTLQNWVNEFHKWIPEFKVLLFQGFPSISQFHNFFLIHLQLLFLFDSSSIVVSHQLFTV